FQLRRLTAEIDRALELNPEYTEAQAAKGILLIRLPRLLGGDAERGETLLRRVLQKDPYAVESRLMLAKACESRGDRDEAFAFAAGTSSRSSKLIHGGVRYLEQGDVALVRESAAERQVLRRLAPHLTAPLRMVMPTYGRTMHAKLAVGLWTFEKIASVPADER